MTDESINIVVTDKVDDSISKKFDQIATSADNAYNYIQNLNKALASIQLGPVQQLSALMNQLTGSLASQVTQQQRLQQATLATGNAMAAATQQAQRLVAAQTSAAQAMGNIQAATGPAGAALGGLGAGAARAGQGLNSASHASAGVTREIIVMLREAARGDFTRMVSSATILTQRLGLLSVILSPVGLAIGALVVTVGAGAAAWGQYSESVAQATQTTFGMGQAAGLTGVQIQALAEQTAKAGDQSISGMQKIQQSLIRMGVTNTTIVKEVSDSLKDYQVATGEKAPEALKQWGDAFANPIAGIKTLEKTLGDINQPQIDMITKLQESGDIVGAQQALYNAFITKINGARDSMSGMAKTADGAGQSMSNFWRSFGQGVGQFFAPDATKTAQDYSGFGQSPVLQQSQQQTQQQQALAKSNAAQAEANRLSTAAGDAADKLAPKLRQIMTLQNEETAIRAALNAKAPGFSSPQEVSRANDQLAEGQRRITQLQTTPDDKKEESRAIQIQKENTSLDDQISRLGELKDARTVQQQLDQIELKFINNRRPLDQEEIASFQTRLKLIQQMSEVQAQRDSIEGQFTQPTKTYNNRLDAANQLQTLGPANGGISNAQYSYTAAQAEAAKEQSQDVLGLNSALSTYKTQLAGAALELDAVVISQKKYNETVAAAQFAYKQSTDDYAKTNQALKDQIALQGQMGTVLQRNQFLQQQQNRLQPLGKSIYANGKDGALTPEASDSAKLNDQANQGKLVDSEVSSTVGSAISNQNYVKTYQDQLKAIQALETAGTLSHENSVKAQAATTQKYNDIQLQGYTDFFTDLTTLSTSSNQALADIGKAASVANATIKGYEAVQNAWATVPYPLNIAAAAAIGISTAMNVEKIVSTSTNVGSFATGGQFTVAGQAGVDANNINMNVTRGERVTIETAAQQRANDAASNTQAAPSPNVNVPVKIINNLDSSTILDALDSDSGEQVIMNMISKNRKQVNGLLGTSGTGGGRN